MKVFPRQRRTITVIPTPEHPNTPLKKKKKKRNGVGKRQRKKERKTERKIKSVPCKSPILLLRLLLKLASRRVGFPSVTQTPSPSEQPVTFRQRHGPPQSPA